MIIDTDLEKRTDWEKHIGPDIGGVPPDDCGWYQWPECMKFYTKGKAYADWLAALHRPVLPNTGHLALSFEIMTDINSMGVAQAIEFDTRVSIAGMNYNFSAQLNYAESGMLQLSDVNGHWVDTGFHYGKLSPGIWTPIRMVYQFDQNLHVYATMEAWIGEQRWKSPSGLVLPAQNLKWGDSCSLQIQQDLGAGGGDYAIYTRKMMYTWS